MTREGGKRGGAERGKTGRFGDEKYFIPLINQIHLVSPGMVVQGRFLSRPAASHLGTCFSPHDSACGTKGWSAQMNTTFWEVLVF